MIIKVFQVGEYPQGSWPLPRVKKLVDVYDPIGFVQAPGVVGHIENFTERIENELAYCWVESLSMDEFGNVWADIPNEEISPQLRSWIINKNLKYISSEIMPFDEMKGEDRAEPYLWRVAFLGRSIPAVPAARVPSFFKTVISLFSKRTPEEEKTFSWFGPISNEAVEDLVNFCAASSKPGPAPQTIDAHTGQRVADGNNPEGPQGPEEEEEPMTEEEKKEFETLKTQNAALQVQNKALGDKVAGFEKEAVDRETKEKLIKLRDEGKITPAQFAKLEKDVTEMEERSREVLFTSLEGAAPVVSLGTDHKAAGAGEKKFSGGLVQRIQAFAREKGIDYEDAASQLYQAEPALFEGDDSGAVIL